MVSHVEAAERVKTVYMDELKGQGGLMKASQESDGFIGEGGATDSG